MSSEPESIMSPTGEDGSNKINKKSSTEQSETKLTITQSLLKESLKSIEDGDCQPSSKDNNGDNNTDTNKSDDNKEQVQNKDESTKKDELNKFDSVTNGPLNDNDNEGKKNDSKNKDAIRGNLKDKSNNEKTMNQDDKFMKVTEKEDINNCNNKVDFKALETDHNQNDDESGDNLKRKDSINLKNSSTKLDDNDGEDFSLKVFENNTDQNSDSTRPANATISKNGIKTEESMNDVKMNSETDSNDIEKKKKQSHENQSKSKISNIITEVVVGDSNDEVTLDLSKTLLSNNTLEIKNKDAKTIPHRQPLSENFANTPRKRTRSSSLTSMAQDLTLPASKRRNIYSNGDTADHHQQKQSNDPIKDYDLLPSSSLMMIKDNGDIIQDGKEEDLDIEDDKDQIVKQKLIRRLKQQLFTEEMKLLFLKKIRQSQLKENISHQQHQHQQQQSNTNTNNVLNNHHNHPASMTTSNNINMSSKSHPAAVAALANNLSSSAALATGSGVNLAATNLHREFAQQLLAQQQSHHHSSHYQSALSQAGLNSVLNFSMNASHHGSSTKNSPIPSLINNNAAHSNNHSNVLSLHQKNYHSNAAATAAAAAAAINFSANHQMQQPMQAHMSKSSHVKNVSNSSAHHLNHPPYHVPSNLGRSPYNYLNNPLSAPPLPSLHQGSTSNKQRHGHHSESPHNLNMAHTSSSKSSSSTPINRSIAASSPNLAHNYQDLRHSSSTSSKHNQIPQQNVSQNISSPSPTTNQMDNTVASNSNTKEHILIQKQLATFKQAMRKHLEKMPQPKMIPSEMHFIPNPSNVEFIYYVGLETVVNYLTGLNQSPQPPEPFECVQCGTDFTPVWKWKDRSNPHKPSVICEKCVSKNMKKIISDEYHKDVTNYSKTFEEIEKHISNATSAAGNITPPSAAISPSMVASASSNQMTNVPVASIGQQSQRQPNTTIANNNLFGSNNNSAVAAAAAAAAANFNLQQAHSQNSPLPSLSVSQMAAMAALLMPQAATNPSQPTVSSTPPAAHSGSSRSSASAAPSSSSNFNSNLTAAAALGATNPAAAALTFLQQLQSLPKITNQAQSLLLAQQLLAAGAAASSPSPTAAATSTNSNAAAMAQLLGFPNFFYTSLLAASLANSPKTTNSPSSSSSHQQTSALNAAAAAAAAGIPRQLLMEMLPGGSNSASGHHTRGSGHSQHNWKS